MEPLLVRLVVNALYDCCCDWCRCWWCDLCRHFLFCLLLEEWVLDVTCVALLMRWRCGWGRKKRKEKDDESKKEEKRELLFCVGALQLDPLFVVVVGCFYLGLTETPTAHRLLTNITETLIKLSSCQTAIILQLTSQSSQSLIGHASPSTFFFASNRVIKNTFAKVLSVREHGSTYKPSCCRASCKVRLRRDGLLWLQLDSGPIRIDYSHINIVDGANNDWQNYPITDKSMWVAMTTSKLCYVQHSFSCPIQMYYWSSPLS